MLVGPFNHALGSIEGSIIQFVRLKLAKVKATLLQHSVVLVQEGTLASFSSQVSAEVLQ